MARVEGWECPDCAPDPGRRRVLAGAGAMVAAAAAGSFSVVGQALAAVEPVAKGTKVPVAESSVARLFASLTAEQKKVCVMPFDHPKATQVGANWAIVEPTIGQLFNEGQQRIVHEILRGVTSEDGYERMLRQMSDDSGGFENYHCALFGDPSGKLEWVMTGRHLTIRANGSNAPDTVFGGPIVYGHGLEGDYKKNLFHYQVEAVNQVFKMLDEKQRAKALLEKAPPENSITIKKEGFAGISGAELTEAQQELLIAAGHTLLAPYRQEDQDAAIRSVTDHGGMEGVHLSFYKNEDLGSDGEWDIWRLEGPTFVWHFRGAPHVHTWVNFRSRPA